MCLLAWLRRLLVGEEWSFVRIMEDLYLLDKFRLALGEFRVVFPIQCLFLLFLRG